MLVRLIELIDKNKLKTGGGIKAIANVIGLPYTTLYSLYTGKNNNPTIGTVKKICDFYGVKISNLLDEDCESEVRVNTLDEIKYINESARKISIVNNNLIESISEDSILHFRKFNDGIVKSNNYYICDYKNKLVIRKVIKEDDELILTSEKMIIQNELFEFIIMELELVRIC